MRRLAGGGGASAERRVGGGRAKNGKEVVARFGGLGSVVFVIVQMSAAGRRNECRTKTAFVQKIFLSLMMIMIMMMTIRLPPGRASNSPRESPRLTF